LVDIPERMIGGMQFEKIYFGPHCVSLRVIHPNAFDSSVNATETFVLDASYIPANQTASFYSVVNKFTRLTYLRYHSRLDHLDSNSFSTNLKSTLIYLVLVPTNVSGSPFLGMNRLTELALYHGKLSRIPRDVLNIGEANSINPLSITLEFDQMNDTCFELGALTHPSLEKRKVHLSLTKNNFTYLDEKIFRPFLLANKLNVVSLFYNPLDCEDKRSAWVCNLQREDKFRIDVGVCTNGKRLTDCENSRTDK
jgi:hypothetical protein